VRDQPSFPLVRTALGVALRSANLIVEELIRISPQRLVTEEHVNPTGDDGLRILSLIFELMYSGVLLDRRLGWGLMSARLTLE
jgi:hypothetical protein